MKEYLKLSYEFGLILPTTEEIKLMEEIIRLRHQITVLQKELEEKHGTVPKV